MKKFTVSLPTNVYQGYEAEAERLGKPVLDLIRDTLTDIAISNGWVDGDFAFDIVLYRELSSEVADEAARIQNESTQWHEDITLRAIRACQSKPGWLARYKQLIGDENIYVAGNGVKSSVNQNFGQYVKVKLKAKNKLDQNGKRVSVQVAGEIVRTYTLLVPSDQND